MNYSILIVDDDEDDFIVLAAKIKQCHQNVILTYASSGAEASQKLIDGLQPNLIIVDVQMPKMDGYELLVWIEGSENWNHIPVVIWTGEISTQEVKRYYRAGANSLLLKQDAFQDIETFCQYWFKLVQLTQLAA
ncbi:response regulator [Spirosoma endophyticum]|uniref:CheY chemotaxis protein or a CheY-like REC (Receiver) domain n=1 Tax=Spirosoma endophyticum TaxID=662367 RepID=A0A1I2GX76_9BACT|nr:response regulator [Spirosoma endophyticum]SFF22544.1 CheY chemotaxis protein or a CheY-like REC (receiver) domain [Spirosoma endophyticum]